MIFLFKILCKSIAILTFRSVEGSWKWASNTVNLGEKITLEIHLKNCRVDFEKPQIDWDYVSSLNLIFYLVTNVLDLTCKKRIEKLEIFFVVFSFSMWSLTCLAWNYTVTIFKKFIQLTKMLIFCSILNEFIKTQKGLGHVQPQYWQCRNLNNPNIGHLSMV